MYRLIIADDEHCIRENLATLVHWEELGFEVVGQAANGRDVLSLIPKVHPDVLLMDIKMPYVTGLDVARHVYANKLSIRTVLLSGHQEFAFAKDAANYGVYKYLLKPTKLDEINTSFRSLKQVLDEQYKSTLEYQRVLTAYHDSLRMLRYQTLHDFLYLPKPDNLLQYINSMPTPLFLPAFVLLHLTFENLDRQLAERWHYEADLFENLLLNVIRNAGSDMHVSLFPLDGSDFLIVANANYADEFPAYKTHLEKEMSQLIGAIFSLRCGKPFHDVSKLREEFTHFVPQAAHISDVENEGLMLTALIEGDTDRLNVLLQAVLLDKPPNQHPALIARLYAHLRRGLRDLGMDSFDAPTPTDEVSMAAWMKDMVGKWHEYSRWNTADQRLVQRIKQYMFEHLSEDISLKHVANHVFLSPAYVSKLFKQATGENFIDALKRMRVDKACQLLRDPELRIYEIASATGYNSPKYFMKVFREYMHTTPTEYRRHLGQDGREES